MCVCFSHLPGFFCPPSAVEGTRAAVTNLGFTIKLNSESPLATGSINEGYRNDCKDDLKGQMDKKTKKQIQTIWDIWMRQHFKTKKYSELWIAFHFAPLLVIWSPWVNGFTLPCSLCSGPSLHLLSLRTCQFLFFIFPHSSQDNAWDYDPATQVWGCRDSGGCSYYCHWGGSGKSPHLSGNASSDSTNTSPPHPLLVPPLLFFFLWHHSIITAEGSRKESHLYFWSRH